MKTIEVNMLSSLVFDYNENTIINSESNSLENELSIMKPLFFDELEFHKYHQKFAEKVYKLYVKYDNKILGYCYFGLRGDCLFSPYSSPFSLIYLKNKYNIEHLIIFVNSIKKVSILLGIKKIRCTLPPEIYNSEYINQLYSAFNHERFIVSKIDINNYYILDNYINKDEYLKNTIHKVRKNYRTALANNLTFKILNKTEMNIVYQIIKINRSQMNYSLKMSEKQINDLIKMESLVPRFFGVFMDDNCLASAIAFDVNDDISQIIYWGDNINYRNLRPMELLTTGVFDYFNSIKKKYIDVGPSSEDGIINSGLVGFKQSIGCNSIAKISFEYNN